MATSQLMKTRGADLVVVLLLALLVVNLFPLYVMVSISVKGEGSVLARLSDLIPREPTLENYAEILSQGPFARYFLNSTVVVAFVVVGNIVFASMAAYAIARSRHRYSNVMLLLIISTMMKRTSHVPEMLRDGAQAKVMRLLHRQLGKHSKRRCNDYLRLMYLMMLGREDEKTIEDALDALQPEFLARIASLNEVSMETARESNRSPRLWHTLFEAYRHTLARVYQKGWDDCA